MVCKYCNREVTRTYAGQALVRGRETQRQIWLDDKGRQWNYKQCPECRYAMKLRSDERVKSQRVGLRKCRACNKGLEVNYFYHSKCLAEIEFNDEYV